MGKVQTEVVGGLPYTRNLISQYPTSRNHIDLTRVTPYTYVVHKSERSALRTLRIDKGVSGETCVYRPYGSPKLPGDLGRSGGLI